MTPEHVEPVTAADQAIADVLERALIEANGDKTKLDELLKGIVQPLRDIEARERYR